MDAKQFLAEFGHIANAPGGTQRLRELILQLGISGRLLSSYSTDQSITLYESILDCRNALAKKGEIRLGKPFPELELSHHLFDIPLHWLWVWLGEIGDWGAGATPNRKNPDYYNGQILWLKSGELNGAVVCQSEEKVTDKALKEASLRLNKKGDVMVAMYGATIGKTAIAGEICTTNQAVCACTPFEGMSNEYLHLTLKAYKPIFIAQGSGGAQPNISREKIINTPIPLPPLEEQSRIVAKVDELMAICDKLEAQQQKKRKLQNKLRQSVLQAVAHAESPKELQDSWERLAGNFSHLLAEEGDVADFKGMILDLAVSGHLLKYGKVDSTGKDVLSLVKEERLKWTAESKDQELKEAQAMIKKIRNQKITSPDAPLPKHWTWGSFLQISQVVIDCHNKTAPYVSDGIHLVRTTDIRDGKMNLRNTKKITEETYAYWARRMPPRSGDIFFTREAPMGEAAIVPEGEKICLGQRTLLIRLFPHLFNNQFLVYVIQSPSFQKRMLEDAIGMAVKHLRVGGVEDLIVPIPPKNEQDKLVEIIRDLFKICDRFHNQLQRERVISANLAMAAIASLTGISTPQQEEPMKVPKTELKVPVRLGTVQPSNNTQAPLASLLARHNGEMGANDLWQRFGGEIDAFYAQLKTEVKHGWIAEPTGAQMLEKEAD